MCRLFGLSGSPNRVRATFWLLDAADSLAAQSRREPDGTGLGFFEPDGTPRVDKQPVAAYRDADFAREAKEVVSTTFLAHLRFASTGDLDMKNTHPFVQNGRIFAHNGVVGALDRLDAQLGSHRSLVRGDTDSERLFALITRQIDLSGGDVGAGITSAVGWVAAHLPLYSINLILTTPTDLWALRYTETHDLLVLRRRPGGPHGVRHLDHANAAGTVRVRSADLSDLPAVVIASERMDEDPGGARSNPANCCTWGRPSTSGSVTILDRPPAHLLTLADLDPRAAGSQAPAGSRASASSRPSAT